MRQIHTLTFLYRLQNVSFITREDRETHCVFFASHFDQLNLKINDFTNKTQF